MLRRKGSTPLSPTMLVIFNDKGRIGKMSEAILIALIGIVPSVLVAIVSIISNNAIIKVKIEELEK